MTPTLRLTRLTRRPGRPLLVLTSSLGTSSQVWDQVVDLLGDAAEVVAVDHPGHGASAPTSDPLTVEDLAAGVLAALDAEPDLAGRPFTAAGLSLGGAVTLQLLLDAPDRVRAGAVVGSSARIGEPTAWEERAALVRRDGTAVMVEGSRERWFAPGNRGTDVAESLLEGLPAVDDESYARCCEALGRFDVRDRLGEIGAPLVVVSGQEDPVAPPEAGALVAARGHGRHVVLAGVGHLAPAESPAAVAAELRDLLRGPVDEAYRAGMAVRRSVLGDTHVDRATDAADDVTRDFQELITRYAWGGIWTRPGLDRRTRSLVTITALVAGHHWHELEMHLRAAVDNNGVTREEIVEVLLQSAVYCSVPSANTAFRIAREFFAARDEETQP